MQAKEGEIIDALRFPATREAAFEVLVTTYQKPLYSHLRRMLGNHEDADDALQNTFIKVWRNVDRFRGDASLFSWLYRIATNEALNIINQKVPYNKTSKADEMSLVAASDGPDGDAISRKLQAAMLTLPEKQRQVFDLRYFEEMKYSQIAEITGTSVGALKASYFHAVKKIEAALARFG